MTAQQTLRLDRFTPEAKALVVSAQSLADERKHLLVEPLHLLARALEGDRGAGPVFAKAGVDVATLALEVDAQLSQLTRSTGSLAYLSNGTMAVLTRAEKEAGTAAVNTGHLLNSLSQEVRGGTAEALQSVGLGPGSLRPYMALLKTPARTADSGADLAAADPFVRFTRDMVALAKRDAFDPVIGREIVIRRLVQILERRSKNHPLLVGEPGIGKSAVVHGLAMLIAAGKVPINLVGARILELEVGNLVAGAKLRGDIEDRLKQVLDAVKGASEESILFVAGIDSLFGPGAAGSAVGDLLKPLLVRGDIRLLATTTPAGLRKLEERDPVFVRRFSKLILDPPTPEQAIAILRGVAPRYEAHHHVTISDPALTAAVRLAKRYLQDRSLPDNAIDLLDEAAARKRVEEGASSEGAIPTVVEHDIAVVLGEWTGIPVAKMLEAESDKLLKMEERLSQRVIGQSEAVRAVSRATRRGRVGLRDARRPIGSFLFLGPSGVGKTELAKALAEFLFDDEQAMTRLDMSEFMEKHMAQRLLGAPPGYVDSEEGGYLTEAVRRKPYSVLLFDEVEKAHADVFNLLLQVLDDGRLTDGRGRTADFSNTVIIMTSNIGSQRILDTDPKILEHAEGREALQDVLRDELKAFLRPEFLNRIDDIVIFRSLSKDDLRGILTIQLRQLEALLSDRALTLRLTDAARAFLIDLGYEPAFGARPLKRAIQKQVQDPLAEEILGGKYASSGAIRVNLHDGQLTFTTEGDPPSPVS